MTDTPHPVDIALGRRVHDRRRAIKMTQAELANAVGITFQQVQKYERGANRISFSRLVAIAEALQCHLVELTEGLGSPQRAVDVDQERRLLAEEGAVELLEAYSAMDVRLRRAIRQLAGHLIEPPA
jgi:transcriptional regulator with XRE-family HTH domain